MQLNYFVFRFFVNMLMKVLYVGFFERQHLVCSIHLGKFCFYVVQAIMQ